MHNFDFNLQNDWFTKKVLFILQFTALRCKNNPFFGKDEFHGRIAIHRL